MSTSQRVISRISLFGCVDTLRPRLAFCCWNYSRSYGSREESPSSLPNCCRVPHTVDRIIPPRGSLRTFPRRVLISFVPLIGAYVLPFPLHPSLGADTVLPSSLPVHAPTCVDAPRLHSYTLTFLTSNHVLPHEYLPYAHPLPMPDCEQQCRIAQRRKDGPRSLILPSLGGVLKKHTGGCRSKSATRCRRFPFALLHDHDQLVDRKLYRLHQRNYVYHRHARHQRRLS